MKAASRTRAPTTVKRTVRPGRRPNGHYRTREYLTEKEVERLMKAASRNRYGHRGCDHDPAGLPAWPASVRTVLPALGAGRSRPCPAARLTAQERHTLCPPTYRQRTAGLAPPSARTRAKPLSILERAGGTDERRWLPQNDYEAWEGREDAIQRASAYAPPRLWVQTCQ